MVRFNSSVSPILFSSAAFLVLGCGEPQVPPQPLLVPIETAAPAPPPPPPEPAVPDMEPCDAAMHLALQTAIKGREKKELGSGMKAEGAFMCQIAAEGGVVKLPVTLQPRRCYTFLAHSFPNVTDIDVMLRPNLGPNPPALVAAFASAVLAQDSEQGPIASIGSGSTCFTNPLPIPAAAVADVLVKLGSGPVAIQVYSK